MNTESIKFNPLIQVLPQLFDGTIDLLPESNAVKLLLDRFVETLTNTMGLWTTGFGLAMVNVFHGQVKLIFVTFPGSAVFSPTKIGQHIFGISLILTWD